MPHDIDYDVLDPGIRQTVKMLRDAGFETTDSGDGVTKPFDERVFDFPHVAAVTTPLMLVEDAHRMFLVLGKSWVVEASYTPHTGTALLFARPPVPEELDSFR